VPLTALRSRFRQPNPLAQPDPPQRAAWAAQRLALSCANRPKRHAGSGRLTRTSGCT